ncbi:uncharacterized protein LOC129589849 isoform X2 [Paramacrobiotus metropolitanus]|nr:uncharacterized protein LOC129589849 isoform X2 [Paramacrobiotus metropolitanus]
MWKVDNYFWMLFFNATMWGLIAFTEITTFFRLPSPGKPARVSHMLRVLRDHTLGVAFDTIIIFFYLYQFTPSHVSSITRRIVSFGPFAERDTVATHSDAEVTARALGTTEDDRVVIINVFGGASFVALILLCVTEWMCAVCYFQATQSRYVKVKEAEPLERR